MSKPTETPRILILEDDRLLRRELSAFLREQGWTVAEAATVTEAAALIEKTGFEAWLIDVHLPDGSGLKLLQDSKTLGDTAVICMTGESSVQVAVEAMRLGAVDFLSKPFDPDELLPRLEGARRKRDQSRLEQFRKETGSQDFFFGSDLQPLREQLQRIVEADERLGEHLPPVLLVGETGTGKTSLARWIHHHGPRENQPLVEVNCSALPEALAESELFGHERGAFTDARSQRVGLFEAASRGTLFLDEIPSLAAPVQAKILKALEDHQIRRVGGTRNIPVDVRIIAATNQDLEQLAQSGEFRDDLLHRLDLFRIEIPPLRDRKRDLPELAERLIQKVGRRHKLPDRTLSASGRQRLMEHHWPGNVRELSHEIERALVFEGQEEIQFERLDPRSKSSPTSQDPNDWFNENYRFKENEFDLEAANLRIIRHALNQTNQNVSAAARLLGVPRDYIRYRLRKTSK